MPQVRKTSRLSVGKTAEEVHADVVAEGHDVTVEEIEEKLEEMVALGFIQEADFSLGDLSETD